MRIRKGGAKRGCSPEWWIEAEEIDEFHDPRFKDYGYTWVLDGKFFKSKSEAEDYIVRIRHRPKFINNKVVCHCGAVMKKTSRENFRCCRCRVIWDKSLTRQLYVPYEMGRASGGVAFSRGR